MKVHAFRVASKEGSTPLEDILQNILNVAAPRDRIRIINTVEVRAETITQQAIAGRAPVWLLDCVRIRTDHGPGRVGRDSEMEGFEFTADEGFGHETAALFDPTNHHLLVQYNHTGVRANTIADYLSAFIGGGTSNLYSLIPKCDPGVEERLTRKGITRRLKFTVDISKMSAQDRERGIAVSEALDFGRNLDGDKIKLEICASGDRGRSLGERALQVLEGLKSMAGQNPDVVTKLEVAGKEDKDDALEVLDLIRHRLAREFTDLKTGRDLRYSRADRFNALLRAHVGWTDLLNT